MLNLWVFVCLCCTEAIHITGHPGLTGTIPSEIGRLDQLSKCDLSILVVIYTHSIHLTRLLCVSKNCCISTRVA